MSDIISAVKGQAVQMNDSTTSSFTIEDLVKRIDLLMKHELKKYHCSLVTDFQADLKTEIKGELNNLVQIFDNIIMNAIQAYEGETGDIFFQIIGTADTIQFSLRDHGRGIPEQIQRRLFREMVTTKGKNGTGLGLYMSYSTIKGRFGGDLWFTSAEGEGTTIYIAIPHFDKVAMRGGKKDEERT
jgi:signal transduction histidine kinase